MKSLEKTLAQANEIFEDYGVDFLNSLPLTKKQKMDKAARTEQADALGTFFVGLVRANVKSVSKITRQDVLSTIDLVDKDLPKDSRGSAFFDFSIRMGIKFLKWLSDQDILKMTNEQIDEALQQAIIQRVQQTSILAELVASSPEESNSDRETYHYDKSELPKFNPVTAAKIRAKMRNIVAAFVTQGALDEVSHSISTRLQRNIGICLIGFGDHMYGEYRRTPSRWSERALRGVLTGYFVKDAPIFLDEYSQVVNILKKFMDYCAESNFIKGQIAKLMNQGIDKYGPEMVKLGTQKANYSAGKQEMLATIDEEDRGRSPK